MLTGGIPDEHNEAEPHELRQISEDNLREKNEPQKLEQKLIPPV